VWSTLINISRVLAPSSDWEPGRVPLAAQLFLHTPGLGQTPPEGRLLIEDRVIFQGSLPLGTWSRDVLLDADVGEAVASKNTLRLALETNTFLDLRDGGPRRIGVGLVALAVV